MPYLLQNSIRKTNDEHLDKDTSWQWFSGLFSSFPHLIQKPYYKACSMSLIVYSDGKA